MAINKTAAQKNKEAELKAAAGDAPAEGSPEALQQLLGAKSEQELARNNVVPDEADRDLSTIVVLTGYGRYNSPLGLLVKGQEFNAKTKENLKALCRMRNTTTGAKVFTPAEEYYEAQVAGNEAVDLNAIAGNAGNQRGGVEEV